MPSHRFLLSPQDPRWPSVSLCPLLESGCAPQVPRGDRRRGHQDGKIAGPSFPFASNHPSVLYRYVNLLIHRGPENIATRKTFRFAVGERNLRVCVSITERLQKIENG